jgi:DNA-binding Lrp family transcriptional regulator
MKLNRRKGIWIPKHYLEDNTLDWESKVILTEVESLQKLNEKDGAYASDSHYAKLIGKSRPTATRRIKELVDNGYLTKVDTFSGGKRTGKFLKTRKRDKNSSLMVQIEPDNGSKMNQSMVQIDIDNGSELNINNTNEINSFKKIQVTSTIVSSQKITRYDENELIDEKTQEIYNLEEQILKLSDYGNEIINCKSIWMLKIRLNNDEEYNKVLPVYKDLINKRRQYYGSSQRRP